MQEKCLNPFLEKLIVYQRLSLFVKNTDHCPLEDPKPWRDHILAGSPVGMTAQAVTVPFRTAEVTACKRTVKGVSVTPNYLHTGMSSRSS